MRGLKEADARTLLPYRADLAGTKTSHSSPLHGLKPWMCREEIDLPG
jgi:hypothetical protein